MSDHTSTAVVIAGMHRSGTSFVASALQAAGLPVGERLLTDFPGNPRGHFEDVDFLALHEAALAALPEGSFVASDRPLAFDDEQRRRAAALVAARSPLPFWGFKDPRTTLFLDEWHALLPRPRWVFVYRHPLEVLVSILQRGINHDVLAVPELGLRVWHVYNERLLAFHAAHRTDGVLASIDAVTRDVPAFIELVGKKLDLRLDPGRSAGLYQADEMRSLPMGPRVEQLLERLHPDVSALLARLDTAADLPRPPGGNTTDPDDVALVQALVAAPNEALAAAPGAPALAALLALLAPETWARVPGRLLDAIRVLEQEQRKLGAEWARHKEQIEDQVAYVQALEAHVQALEAERAHLSAEIERLGAALAEERALPTWKRLLRST